MHGPLRCRNRLRGGRSLTFSALRADSSHHRHQAAPRHPEIRQREQDAVQLLEELALACLLRRQVQVKGCLFHRSVSRCIVHRIIASHRREGPGYANLPEEKRRMLIRFSSLASRRPCGPGRSRHGKGLACRYGRLSWFPASQCAANPHARRPSRDQRVAQANGSC